MEALTPEAGDRRYFRPVEVNGWLEVKSLGPPPRATTDWLHQCGVRVPEIGADTADGYWVEDLGDIHLCHQPSAQNYRFLLGTWQRFGLRELPGDHPNAKLALDGELFERELWLSCEHWLIPRLSTVDPEQLQLLCTRLALLASAGPSATQHRDFHSRNVLLPKEGGIALIDHQDLRTGPVFYDLASLWTDAYLEIPPDCRALLRGSIEQLGNDFGLSGSELHHRFLFSALQRVIKALGTFGKLIANGRDDYEEPAGRAMEHFRHLLDPTSLEQDGFKVGKKWQTEARAWRQLLL